MNSNPAMQNIGLLMWDGEAAIARQINKFRNFGFVFEVIAAVAANAVFQLESAPPDPADPCAPDDTWSDVEAVPICSQGVDPGELATFTIPAGTPVGTIATATIPCTPDAFIRFATGSGTVASVRIVGVLQGPMGLYASAAAA